MSTDVRAWLPLYALGVLAPDEADQVERAVAADPALAAELASYQLTTEQLVARVRPSVDVKARLMASVGAGRYERHARRMGSLFDVSAERAHQLLGLIERPASWQAQMPGIELIHFAGGPAYAEADCGFIRIAPGTTFPWHTHKGEEVSLIIAGILRDHTGKLLRPGDELVQVQASEHSITPAGDEEVIFAARAMNGIEVAGVPARPGRG